MRSPKVPRRRVLLVSRDKRLKRQVQGCLAASGLPTTLLTSIDDDLARVPEATKTPPHLIVLDDSIPVQEGPTLLDALHRYAPHALVVYIAGHHTMELERTVRQLGVLYYTAKPADDLLLQRVLTAALQRTTQSGKFAA
jgi:DNA-binding NtrC family response regulator